jgi:putative transposase
MISPKISVSVFVGAVKGKTAIHMFKRFAQLRQRPYWRNHFWAEGYCVDAVAVNEELIRKYGKYQEHK